MLTVDNARVARFVSREPASPGIAVAREGAELRVCADGTSVFEVSLGDSPDAGWQIHALSVSPPLEECDDALGRAFSAWARGTTAERSGEVLRRLPVGEYVLVRSASPARDLVQMPFGNDLRPKPEFVDVLDDSGGFFAAQWRMQSGGPCVALACLGFTGATSYTALLFFEPYAASLGASESSWSPDRILIVPASGPLTLNVIAANRPDEHARWEKTGLAHAIDRLCRQ